MKIYTQKQIICVQFIHDTGQECAPCTSNNNIDKKCKTIFFFVSLRTLFVSGTRLQSVMCPRDFKTNTGFFGNRRKKWTIQWTWLQCSNTRLSSTSLLTITDYFNDSSDDSISTFDGVCHWITGLLTCYPQFFFVTAATFISSLFVCRHQPSTRLATRQIISFSNWVLYFFIILVHWKNLLMRHWMRNKSDLEKGTSESHFHKE